MNYSIQLKALDKRSLTIYKNFIELIFKKLNVNFSIIYLPKKIKRITLLKSPHVYKKSKEQFQITVFKLFIKIKSKINFDVLKYVLLNKSSLIKIKLLKDTSSFVVFKN